MKKDDRCLTDAQYVCCSFLDLIREENRYTSTATHVRAGSPSSCVCTACSSTPRLSAACPCGRPPERGHLSEPEPPGLPPAAPPPPPESSGGPPDSQPSQLRHETHTDTTKSPLDQGPPTALLQDPEAVVN